MFCDDYTSMLGVLLKYDLCQFFTLVLLLSIYCRSQCMKAHVSYGWQGRYEPNTVWANTGALNMGHHTPPGSRTSPMTCFPLTWGCWRREMLRINGPGGAGYCIALQSELSCKLFDHTRQFAVPYLVPVSQRFMNHHMLGTEGHGLSSFDIGLLETRDAAQNQCFWRLWLLYSSI